MSDEAKQTGLGHDDDGNIDDKRIAAWVMLVAVLAFAGYGVFWGSQTATGLVGQLVWPTLALFGVSVAEKFRRK